MDLSRSSSLYLCVAALLAGFCLSAPGRPRSPIVAAVRPDIAAPLKTETYYLSNGMAVSLIQDPSASTVAVQAVVRVGLLNERSDQRWLSDLVATLLTQGTTTRSAKQLSSETAAMGGRLFTNASTDKMTIGADVRSEFDARLVALISEVVLNPKLAADDLEEIRAAKLVEYAANQTQSGILAWAKFREIVFAGHPYRSISPTETGLKDFTIQHVRSFYYNQYGAARTHLYVAGKFNAAKVKAVIEKTFGTWKKGPDPIRNVPVIRARKSVEIIDVPRSLRSTIYLGMPAVSPSDCEFISFTVMDSLLGSSPNSRITTKLRQNKGRTFAANSIIWNRFKTGYWIENAEVATESTGSSIQDILSEITRLKNEPPSDAELNAVKTYLAGIFGSLNSSNHNLIAQMEYVNYNELRRDYLDNYLRDLVRVTPTEISEMARRYLDPDKMTLVVVGDKSKIADQLKFDSK